MNRMKSLILVLAGLFVAGAVYGGTVTQVSGDVDCLIGGSWTSAYVGMEISDGTKIMTGLDAELKVSTTGGAYVVEELSMVTFNEETSEEATDQNLDLELGTVDVEFKRASGLSMSFSVSTPKGTASIRGTRERVSYFPSSGMNVQVLLGEIGVYDLAGNSIGVSEGQSAGVGANGGMETGGQNLSGFFGESGSHLDEETAAELLNQLIEIFNPYYGILDQLGEPERL